MRRLLEAAWREPGFCVPNPTTYPHQWLWDSCFHAVVWAALGDERGARELANALAHQGRSGFVPHMTYWHAPTVHASFWGRELASNITQPPMYGHAAQRCHGGPDADGRHRPLSADGHERLARAFAHLLFERPRTPSGLVPVVHPWETGCDDSPRWDDFRRPGESWSVTKGELVAELAAAGADGEPPPGGVSFVVGSIGFNALVAWNLRQYLTLPDAHDRGRLSEAGDELAAAVADRWDPGSGVWVDDGPPSGRIRTADALLGLLVDPRDAAFAALLDPDAFGARFGPRGVDRAEPTYRPDVYWRGPAWPQLSYLLWQAAVEHGRPTEARAVARSLVAGAVESGWAEYWEPDTGTGLGAIPQTWAGLALPAAQWLDGEAGGGDGAITTG